MIANKVPKLMMDIKLRIQEAKRISSRITI
jgi:hypothetical protein